MDFEHDPQPGDGAAYRAAAGLAADELVLLQPTRVVPRKGIETTLRLAHQLADDHLKVVVTHADGDEGFAYGQRLRAEADQLGVDLRFVPVRADFAQEAGGPSLAGDLSPEALAQAAKVLEDPTQGREAAERNYQIGWRRFSFAAIRERLLPLINGVAPCYRGRVASSQPAQ